MPSPVSLSLPRRERERLLRRQAMLEAARAVFAEKGYTHATVDEIAQRAEFGKGTLYNYFKGGKEDILFAIFDALYDDLHELITTTFTPEAIASRPIRVMFRHLFEESLGYFVDQQDLFLILIKEAHRLMFSDEANKADYFIHQRGRIVDALKAPLEAAMARGELKPLPIEPLAHMILHHINGMQMHQCLCGTAAYTTLTPGEAADFLTTLLFDGILVAPRGDAMPSAGTPAPSRNRTRS